MKIISCHIPGHPIDYEIEITSALLNDQKKLFQSLNKLASRFAIITDSTVAPLYGERLRSLLLSSGLDASLFSFPTGEAHKTRATKERLEDQLHEKGFGRDTCILALGGGVATDLAGYLAATYCRGVPLIMIPTTLLGMVDASIGGKTGVNVPLGKNLVGSIYQPKKVLIDPFTLRSLPLREIKNGLVEVIKHALIADPQLFRYLDEYALELLKFNIEKLEKVIFESCRIKKKIVEMDEKETGMRRLLNFGHTIGHALEHVTNYILAHGEAVAIGILVESRLSHQLGYLSKNSFNEIFSIFHKFAFPMKLPSSISIPSILEAMTLDKKSLKGKLRCVLIQEIGSPYIDDSSYCTEIEEKVIENALKWMINDLCCH